jgi:hypothetical protein
MTIAMAQTSAHTFTLFMFIFILLLTTVGARSVEVQFSGVGRHEGTGSTKPFFRMGDIVTIVAKNKTQK